MTSSAVTIDAHQTLDVRLQFATQVAFDSIRLQHRRQVRKLFIIQVLRANVWIDVRLLAGLKRGRRADSVNVTERDPDLLLVWYLYTNQTCHSYTSTLDAVCDADWCKLHAPLPCAAQLCSVRTIVSPKV